MRDQLHSHARGRTQITAQIRRTLDAPRLAPLVHQHADIQVREIRVAILVVPDGVLHVITTGVGTEQEHHRNLLEGIDQCVGFLNRLAPGQGQVAQAGFHFISRHGRHSLSWFCQRLSGGKIVFITLRRVVLLGNA